MFNPFTSSVTLRAPVVHVPPSAANRAAKALIAQKCEAWLTHGGPPPPIGAKMAGERFAEQVIRLVNGARPAARVAA